MSMNWLTELDATLASTRRNLAGIVSSVRFMTTKWAGPHGGGRDPWRPAFRRAVACPLHRGERGRDPPPARSAPTLHPKHQRAGGMDRPPARHAVGDRVRRKWPLFRAAGWKTGWSSSGKPCRGVLLAILDSTDALRALDPQRGAGGGAEAECGPRIRVPAASRRSAAPRCASEPASASSRRTDRTRVAGARSRAGRGRRRRQRRARRAGRAGADHRHDLHRARAASGRGASGWKR